MKSFRRGEKPSHPLPLPAAEGGRTRKETGLREKEVPSPWGLIITHISIEEGGKEGIVVGIGA